MMKKYLIALLLLASSYNVLSQNAEDDLLEKWSTIYAIDNSTAYILIGDRPHKMALSMKVRGPDGEKLNRYALKRGQVVSIVTEDDYKRVPKITEIQILD